MAKIYENTGQPIKIITARPFRAATDTYLAADKLFKTPFELVLTQGKINKSEYLKGINYFVEDRRKNVIELAHAFKKVFMPKYDYNDLSEYKSEFNILPSIIEIDTLERLLFYIDEFWRY